MSITVEDSGKGVAPELEDTLFERFTRAGVARDRVAGTGLGSRDRPCLRAAPTKATCDTSAGNGARGS